MHIIIIPKHGYPKACLILAKICFYQQLIGQENLESGMQHLYRKLNTGSKQFRYLFFRVYMDHRGNQADHRGNQADHSHMQVLPTTITITLVESNWGNFILIIAFQATTQFLQMFYQFFFISASIYILYLIPWEDTDLRLLNQ